MAPQGKLVDGKLVSWAAYRNRDISLGHLHPSYQCGICGGTFQLNERCVGLLGNPRSTTCWLSTRPFLYPGNDYRLRAIDGWFLCRRPRCQQCAASPEAATTHLECFELLTRTYTRIDALERLWRGASWRKPWREAPAIVLPEDINITTGAVITVAKGYGLPELLKLPPEVRQIVRDYSQSSLLWRLTAALDLAAQFDAIPSSDFSSIPVRQVAEWQRGSAPVQSEALDHLPIVRLTIDSRGIRKLERLPAGEPRYSSRRFDNMVFIIEDEGCFDGVAALFKDGQVRLELPEEHSGFHTWDTPNPPPLPPRDALRASQTCFYGSLNVPTRFCTIDISSITGLTFFFVFGVFYAIHAHTDTAPYATIPPEYLSRQLQDATTWNYVPIPANDRVLAVGLRGASTTDLLKIRCFLIRTKLAGDISVGPWVQKHGTVHMLASPPTTLIYGRTDTKKLSAIGAFPKSTLRDGENPDSFDVPGPAYCPLTFVQAEVNFSAAPLDNVALAMVFHEEGRSYCRGLLFVYHDGAQRALGDCRVGVDPYETYKTPRTLCASTMSDWETHVVRGLRRVRISFTDRSTGDDDDDDEVVGCNFYEMKGTLHFWFDHEQTQIEVLGRCANTTYPFRCQ